MQWQLAEVNLAWIRYPLEDPRMSTMREEIVRINRLGDQPPGFIWRSVQDLRAYVYHSEHVAFFRQRREWFVSPLREPVAMWWVKDGVRPSVDDAMARLARLWERGSTTEAFTFKRAYDPEGQPFRATSDAQPVE